ncbi:MAG TPA: hypothetical protein VHO69_12735 [Phototrophicaceae bacterium]|nr:hypothetical protein [Phototrophicaceae bacterium]
MRTRLTLLSVLVLLVAVFGVATVGQAQDSMTHTCDSTLVLLLYVAEHDYGFHPMMDVSTFEKGQYAPWFEAMMAEMPDDEMMATEEAMMGGDEMMPTEEAMMGDMVTLAPGNVANEDSACTELRAELEAFFYQTISESMMMDNSGG